MSIIVDIYYFNMSSPFQLQCWWIRIYFYNIFFFINWGVIIVQSLIFDWNCSRHSKIMMEQIHTLRFKIFMSRIKVQPAATDEFFLLTRKFSMLNLLMTWSSYVFTLKLLWQSCLRKSAFFSVILQAYLIQITTKKTNLTW